MCLKNDSVTHLLVFDKLRILNTGAEELQYASSSYWVPEVPEEGPTEEETEEVSYSSYSSGSY